ncbi:uncharacterized protein B0T15DRAFT_508044 [Chaetomium strumarium]|uniref:Uncharacterized protein n=1 Tax=Chaetomium strumarium TaxID=1170767 RepID=A0AAJ0H4S2_9PEZI|nr:hypothetical protein B0T15DRAFT_508044 [Chaetomium strumarium]
MPPSPSAVRAAAKTAASATRVAARQAANLRGSPSAAAATGPKAGLLPKWKYMIISVSFAAVVITGTVYGAGLKAQQEYKAEKKKVQEATLEEKVALLEQHKADLLRQKAKIEAKLAEVRARIKASPEGGGGGTVDGSR